MRFETSHTLDRGRLIVVEVPDGVGKSTLAESLADRLRKEGLSCELMAFPGGEPGTLGHHIYKMHHHPRRLGVRSITPMSLQLLHLAAHVDTIESRIRPTLDAGRWIVLDRFWWSIWVYGASAGIPTASLKAMVRLEKLSWGAIHPDLIILLRRRESFHPQQDRQEFEQLTAKYSELAAREASEENVQLVDNQAQPQEVTERALVEIALTAVGTSRPSSRKMRE